MLGTDGCLERLSFNVHSCFWNQPPKNVPVNSILQLCDPPVPEVSASPHPPVRAAYISLLRSFRNLTNRTKRQSAGEAPQPPIPPQTKSCILHSLEIGGPEAERIVRYLNSPYCSIDITKLKEVIKCGDDAGSVAAGNSVLDLCRATVQT
ncbi:hypothetical protein H0H93_016651, partial [Arthromyces matolae]